ncbi:hypothetical protein G6F59_017868 [Rhizopus arrhizus]|nr:hypothetical protein G6F59_017868 [Rhizopus arrhizus]
MPEIAKGEVHVSYDRRTRTPALQRGQHLGAGLGRQFRHAVQQGPGLREQVVDLDANDLRRGFSRAALLVLGVQPGPAHAQQDGNDQGERHWQIAPRWHTNRHP